MSLCRHNIFNVYLHLIVNIPWSWNANMAGLSRVILYYELFVLFIFTVNWSKNLFNILKRHETSFYLYYGKGAVPHFSSVWPVFLFKQLFAIFIFSGMKKNFHYHTPTFAFFLVWTCVSSSKMLELKRFGPNSSE